MKIGITKFKDSVAPRFETASSFVIFTLMGDQVENRSILNCTGYDGFGRVRLLRDNDIDVLICGGIKSFYRDLISYLKIEIIDDVSLSIEDSLAAIISGRLKPKEFTAGLSKMSSEISHEVLVCWAREMFESHGFRVECNEDESSFPIDLTAELKCPVCGKPINVAICCGAHIYKPEQEIREFHHALKSNFQSSVYFNIGSNEIRECCNNYGIELIDASHQDSNRDYPEKEVIPLIKKIIPGHEAAFGR